MTYALVTGGAGMIGSSLTAALLADGLDVTVLDDLSSGDVGFVPPGARFVRGSVVDRATLEQCLDPVPEQVFHLAALFANQNSVDHPDEDLTVNGHGTLNVLRLAARRGVNKVLHTSSSCVYGGSRAEMNEDAPLLELDTPYAVSKLLGEHYARLWATAYGLDVVIVRPFNCYGPHERPGKYRNVIPNFLARAMNGEPLTITGTGEETRDFTFVADTVACMIAAMRAQTLPGDVFNVGSGTETAIGLVAEKVLELTGSSAGVVHHPRRSWDHVGRRVADVSKAREQLGYRPTVGLDEGLAATYEWLKRMHD